MIKLNLKVLECLEKIQKIDPGRNLTIISHGNKFRLFLNNKEIADDLTMTDLRTISKQSIKLNIVQLVDVSHLVTCGRIKSTDAYLKVEGDGFAGVFLHLIHKVKFQKTTGAVEVVT